jgi:hypothetical protein
MLRTTLIVFATAAALIGGLTADAFARGGDGHMGGGFGHGIAGRHVAGTRPRVDYRPDAGYADGCCPFRPRCSPVLGGGSSGSDPISPFYYLSIQPGPP